MFLFILLIQNNLMLNLVNNVGGVNSTLWLKSKVKAFVIPGDSSHGKFLVRTQNIMHMLTILTLLFDTTLFKGYVKEGMLP